MQFVGNASFVSGRNQIAGTIVGGGLTGQFTGYWFGPQANEIGLVFSIAGRADTRDMRIIGSVAGK